MKVIPLLLVVLLCLTSCASVAAQTVFQLPSILSDNMVLQQQTDAAIWGWDAPKTKVTVAFRGNEASDMAAIDGKWLVRIPTGAAGGPFRLQIKGTNNVELSNVLVGEVWIAGGQSNMWWSVAECEDAEREINSANYPNIRVWNALNPPRLRGLSTHSKQKTVAGVQWKPTSPQTVKNFPGVPYFFARNLYQYLHIPIGIVHVAVPGVEIESFLSEKFIQVNLPQTIENLEYKKKDYPAAKQQYDVAYAKWQEQKAVADSKGEPAPAEPKAPNDPNLSFPGGFFNGMIYPTAPYTIKGFLWWQGESNTERSLQYQILFPGLIQEWRYLWGEDNAPFLFVELANFLSRQTQPSEEDAWPALRNAQRAALRLSYTYEVSAIDILKDEEDVNNIHPRNKQLVGYRLYLAALANIYGVQNLVWTGPTYKSVDFNLSKATVTFEQVGSGLVVKNNSSKLKGFALAGSDRQFFWAEAQIQGNKVILSSKGVSNPVAVRYSWANNPIGNLYNQEGLPAFPFRSDDWNLGIGGL